MRLSRCTYMQLHHMLYLTPSCDAWPHARDNARTKRERERERERNKEGGKNKAQGATASCTTTVTDLFHTRGLKKMRISQSLIKSPYKGWLEEPFLGWLEEPFLKLGFAAQLPFSVVFLHVMLLQQPQCCNSKEDGLP